MRALIVGGSPDADPEHVATLAADADLVVAVDSGAETCVSAGVAVDLVIGDMDSVDPDVLAGLVDDGVEVVRHAADKDDSDLGLALRETGTRGAQRAVLTGITGGRLDHTLAAVGAMVWESGLWPEISEPDMAAWLLAEDGRGGVGLLGTGATVSVFAVEDGAMVSSTGLKWPLDGIALECLESRGLSNVIEAEPARVERRVGLALVVSPQVGDVPPAREA